MAKLSRGAALGHMLEKALQQFRRGRFDDTATLCRKILKQRPDEPNSLHLYGASLLQLGRNQEAASVLTRARSADPNNAEILNNLAVAHRRLGRFDLAIEAGECAIGLSPGYAVAHYNLAIAHEAAGSSGNAAGCYEKALAADPTLIDARRRLADLYWRMGQSADSLAHYDLVLAHAPRDAAIHNARGVVLVDLGRRDEAIVAFGQALAIDDTCTDAHINLANELCDGHGPEKALDHYRYALDHEPLCPDTLANFGHALRQLGRIDEAIETYDRALAEDADHIDAGFGCAVAHLTRGAYTAGWQRYLRRESMKDIGPGVSRAPLGTNLAGVRVLALADQGVGDQIFFLRFLGQMRTRGALVACRLDPRITAMLERARIADRIITSDAPATDFDLTVSVGDLPAILGMTDGSLPPPSIVLPPLEDRVARLAARLADLGPPPYLGLTWRAGTWGRRRMLYKEAPLVPLARALASVHATFLSLQRNPDRDDIAMVAQESGRAVHDLSALNDDLEDMLALMGLIDEYVCVSNTNVHLRATAGRKCRVLVPNPPEFRWMADGAESAWFPGSQIYRQDTAGDWHAALRALGSDLGELRQHGAGQPLDDSGKNRGMQDVA